MAERLSRRRSPASLRLCARCGGRVASIWPADGTERAVRAVAGLAPEHAIAVTVTPLLSPLRGTGSRTSLSSVAIVIPANAGARPVAGIRHARQQEQVVAGNAGLVHAQERRVEAQQVFDAKAGARPGSGSDRHGSALFPCRRGASVIAACAGMPCDRPLRMPGGLLLLAVGFRGVSKKLLRGLRALLRPPENQGRKPPLPVDDELSVGAGTTDGLRHHSWPAA